MTPKEYRDDMLRAVARFAISALERKHAYTKGHSDRVSDLAVRLVRCVEPAWSAENIEYLRIGAWLHDIGKICVEESTLNHTGGKLSTEQIRELEDHPTDGWEILRKTGIDFPSIIRDCILCHHESFDGKHDADMRGYPFGYSGEEIPLAGRIVAIADSFDAMTSKRSYQEQMSVERAVQRLKELGGIRLDPVLVGIFVEKVVPTLAA